MSGVYYAYVTNGKGVVTTNLSECNTAKSRNPEVTVEAFSSEDRAKAWLAKRINKKPPLTRVEVPNVMEDPEYPSELVAHVNYKVSSDTRDSKRIRVSATIIVESEGEEIQNIKIRCSCEDHRYSAEITVLTGLLQKCSKSGNIKIVSESHALGRVVARLSGYRTSKQCHEIEDDAERNLATLRKGQERELTHELLS